MRTFQYSDAKSHKFWNIDVAGKSFTVTYGKINTAGQSQTKTFPTAEKAQAEADKLIREKTGKGYVETTPTAAASTGTDDEAFHRAMEEKPDDTAVWSAYADYLMEQGDPRGEFMQVQLALEDEKLPKAKRDELKKKEKALLKKHERTWLGALADPILAGRKQTFYEGNKSKEGPSIRHTFSRGWLTALTFGSLSVVEARALVNCPEARHLRDLRIDNYAYEAPVGSTETYIDTFYEPGPDIPDNTEAYRGPGGHALLRAPQLKNVRIFRLGEAIDYKPTNGEQYFSCHVNNDLAYHFVKQMPHIEELYLLTNRSEQANVNKLYALPMPELRVLQLFHFEQYPLEKLANNASLGNLHTLVCHPHNREYDEKPGAYIRLAQLKAICRSKNLASLRHLGLRLTDFGDAGAKEIVASGILQRLKVLDLFGGCMTDEGAAILAKEPALKNLTMLSLTANALTPAGVKLLTNTKVPVQTNLQHTSVGPFDDDELPEYLYYGDIE